MGPNWANRTIFTADNLHVLRGMNTATVDLIYLDPPFNSKKQWAAPIGSQAAGAAFKDTWTANDVDDLWHDHLREANRGLHDVILAAKAAGGPSTMSYLLYMSVRLLEMRRVLKETGSIYLHCDPTESHSLKLMMDTIFGRDHFQREIVWSMYQASGFKSQAKNWIRGHDIILYYTMGEDKTFNTQYLPYSDDYLARFKYEDEDGHPLRVEGKKRYRLGQGIKMSSVWDDLGSLNGYASERVGYPTQKPVDLLKRIISASSNEGDIILDPFAGCATAAIAAENLGRQWVGIDLSDKAAELVKYRLQEHLGLFYDVIHRTDLPLRTDLGVLPKPATHKKQLYGEQEGICKGCGGHFPIGNFHVDHIVSRKHGGTDHLSNLQLLCGHCNSRKGKGTMSELMAKLLATRQAT